MAKTQTGVSRRSVVLGAGAMSIAASSTALARPSAARRFPRTQQLLQGYVDARKISGACAALSLGAAPAQFMSIGAQALDGAPAGADTLWRIFSMTKPITGVATLALVEAGKLRLDQPVADFAPEFANLKVLENGVARPARARMLVSHLLTHTSGLRYDFTASKPLADLYREAVIFPGDPTPRPGAPKSLDEFATRLAGVPLETDPGVQYGYGVSIDLLGVVVQRAAGVPLETYLRERLFAPMGMNDTGFYVAPERASRLSALYAVREGRLDPGERETGAMYLSPPAYPSGGGGLVSSAADYSRFCRMLLDDGKLNGKTILSPRTARLSHTNLLPAGVRAVDNLEFGAGMSIATAQSFEPGTEPPGSYSWAGAAGTLMWIDPRNRLTAVMMTQYLPSRAYPLWGEFRRAVYADLTG